MFMQESSIWEEYLEEFSYFKKDGIRKENEPRKYLHKKRSGKAIVLIHGLTDSPYTMTAIGEYFHLELGYDVYLPLLQKHGLKEPGLMKGVSFTEWKKNVQFAIEKAAESSSEVAIGGLSTGGALGFHLSCTHPAVNSGLYLFSAAFRLYGGPKDIFSRFLEYLLMTRFTLLFTSSEPLVGAHPYRYARVPFNSARELVVLMRENDRLLGQFSVDEKYNRKVFSAWSDDDTVVSVDALQGLSKVVNAEKYKSFVISKENKVHHACVVLEESIYAVGSPPGSLPLEPANPSFNEMMEAVKKFESTD